MLLAPQRAQGLRYNALLILRPFPPPPPLAARLPLKTHQLYCCGIELFGELRDLQSGECIEMPARAGGVYV